MRHGCIKVTEPWNNAYDIPPEQYFIDFDERSNAEAASYPFFIITAPYLGKVVHLLRTLPPIMFVLFFFEAFCDLPSALEVSCRFLRQ